jgi:hypothetical protein
MTTLRKIVLFALAVPAVVALHVFSAESAHTALAAAPGGGAAPGNAPGGAAGRGGGRGRGAAVVDTRPRTLVPYFTPATAGAKAPDAEGFLQRWMLLEPIPNGLRGNTGFTSTYVQNAFKTLNFPDQFAKLPKDGDKVTVSGQELAWHALDSTLFNVKLFRFAYGLGKPEYGITCFAITVVDSPREMKDVRLAVGSNAASMWWVNGKLAVELYTDRRMVADDGVSKRLTLNQGPNIIQGAVINGPGMSDFCVRFLDEQGQPVKDIAVDFERAR